MPWISSLAQTWQNCCHVRMRLHRCLNRDCDLKMTNLCSPNVYACFYFLGWMFQSLFIMLLTGELYLLRSVFFWENMLFAFINVTLDWTHFPDLFLLLQEFFKLMLWNLWSVSWTYFHTENTALVCFCVGCKTLVSCWVEKHAGRAFTQKLHLSTISGVRDIFSLVLKSTISSEPV